MFCDCSVDEAISQDLSRPVSERVGEEVVRNMATKLEPPSTTESWEVTSTSMVDKNVDCDLIVAELLAKSEIKVG